MRSRNYVKCQAGELKVQKLDILATELKEKVLDEERLEEATRQLKNQTEDDIEGEFDPERFEELKQDRRSIMIGAVSAAKNHISKAEELIEQVEGREEDQDFKDDRRRDTITNEDYNKVRKALDKYRFLYTHFTAMFYAENQFNDHLVEAVDLEQSLELQKFNVQILEQMPSAVKKAVKNGIDNSSSLQDLEEKVDEKTKDIRSEQRELERKVLELQEKISEEENQEKDNESDDEE